MKHGVFGILAENPVNFILMKNCIAIGLIILGTNMAFSQATFSKRLHVGLGDIGCSIHQLDDGYLLSVSYFCNNDAQSQCLSILRTDPNGEMTSNVEYQNTPWWFCPSTFFGNVGAIIAPDSSYYFTGVIENNGQIGEVFLMKTDDYGDSIWLKSYGDTSFLAVNRKIVQRTDSTLLLYNDKEVGYTDARLWLLEVDMEGNIRWEKEYGQQYLGTYAQYLHLLPNGDILMSYFTVVNPGEGTWMTVARINSQGEMLWESRFAEYDYNIWPSITNVVALDDGGFLVSWKRDNPDGFYHFPPIFIWLDSLGNITNQYNFPDFTAFNIADLIKTDNGTIIGVGDVDLLDYPGLGWIGGWVFAFTQDGEMLWERYIQDISLPDKIGWFTGLIETDSSGLAITGSILTPIGYDVWLLQLDSMGCFEPGCTGEIQVVGGVYNDVSETAKTEIKLYPNPVIGDQLFIELPKGLQLDIETEIIVFDIIGRQLVRQPYEHAIDISGIEKGIYFLKIIHHGRLIDWVGKFIRD